MESTNVQLRVSNLSPDTNESDLRTLFQPFGELETVFVAKDRTGENIGFAFIKYMRHSDAKAALLHLHNYPLDHMVLRVEWSELRNTATAAAPVAPVEEAEEGHHEWEEESVDSCCEDCGRAVCRCCSGCHPGCAFCQPNFNPADPWDDGAPEEHWDTDE